MLRRSPRAVLLWTAAALVSLATAFAVGNTLVSLRHQDQEFGRVQVVVVAAHDLELGTTVRSADLRTRRVRGTREPGALDATADAVGHVVAVPVLNGAVLTVRHLAPRTRDGRDGVVPAGMRAMRVVLEHTTRPAPGDTVDLLATFDPAVVGPGADPTIAVAEAVTVVAVDAAGSSETGAETGSALGVTVLVRPEQARRLAFAAATGTLALSVAPPEAARVSSAR